MKTLFRTFVAIGTLMLAQLGHAAEFWSDQTPITSIYPHGTGMTSIVQYSNALGTCGGTRWAIALDAPNHKVLVASLMLAYAQGQRVQFHVNDRPASCEPLVDRFTVVK